jgi:hypothetical protein
MIFQNIKILQPGTYSSTHSTVEFDRNKLVEIATNAQRGLSRGLQVYLVDVQEGNILGKVLAVYMYEDALALTIETSIKELRSKVAVFYPAIDTKFNVLFRVPVSYKPAIALQDYLEQSEKLYEEYNND